MSMTIVMIKKAGIELTAVLIMTNVFLSWQSHDCHALIIKENTGTRKISKES
jgi:hypothetical protein